VLLLLLFPNQSDDLGSCNCGAAAAIAHPSLMIWRSAIELLLLLLGNHSYCGAAAAVAEPYLII